MTLNDYSVQVSGLPADATEAGVRAHFERVCQSGAGAGAGAAVHEVTFGRDVGRVMALRKLLLALESKHDWLEWLLLRAKKILGEDGVDEDEFDNLHVFTEEDDQARGRSHGGSRSEKQGGGWSRIKDVEVSPAKARWNEAVLAAQAEKKNHRLEQWSRALSAARDVKKSMKERAETAARVARKADKIGLTTNGTPKSGGDARKTVGIMMSYRPQDFNPDILRKKLRENLLEREETADAIAACAQRGYPLVNAWVTFSEEQHCLDCIYAVGAQRTRKVAVGDGGPPSASGGGGGETKVLDDVCVFERKHRIEVKRAQDPSDVLWENLSYPKRTMWKRQLRSMFMTVILILISMAAISAAKAQTRMLPPKVLCEDIGAGGTYLDCPAIWDLESSGGVAGQDTPREHILPFVEQDVTFLTCQSFMKNGKFVGDMSQYFGYYSSQAHASAIANGAGGAGSGGDAHAQATWGGGFDPSSQIDECAAHVCHGCYCRKKGYWDYEKDADGLGSFCEEYWSNEMLRQAILIGGIVVSSGINIVIKLASIVLSELEHAHSLTFQEVSISWKMMTALVINTSLLPLFMGADIHELRFVPFLFEGYYTDVTSEWYADFGNGFVQVAFINALAFPLSCIGKVWLWQLRIKVLTRRVKTQRQLNQLYRPPKFLLSERYGPFLAAMVYTIIFSSGMPVLYAVLVLWCALQILVDRLTLLRYCASPPRYTGKLAALLIHTVPVAVLLHFCVATFVFGERGLPSWTLSGGVSGKWTGGVSGKWTTKTQTTQTTQVQADAVESVDGQWDVGTRLARVNGLIPAVGSAAVGSLMGIAYMVLAMQRRARRRGQVSANLDVEGCPPLNEAIARGLITGLTSYSITANPEYQHLFPPGEEVSEGL